MEKNKTKNSPWFCFIKFGSFHFLEIFPCPSTMRQSVQSLIHTVDFKYIPINDLFQLFLSYSLEKHSVTFPEIISVLRSLRKQNV